MTDGRNGRRLFAVCRIDRSRDGFVAAVDDECEAQPGCAFEKRDAGLRG